MSDSKEQFRAWMQERLEAEQLQLEGWAPSASGYSNETNIFDAHYSKDGMELSKKFVQRLGPADGKSMFRDYNLERQCRVVQYLEKNSDLPVPHIVGLEMAVDRPFYVMEFIGGDIPSDGHTADEAYTTQGFLFEATPEQRETYWFDLVGRMAELHKVPVNADFEDYFQRAPGDQSQLQKEVDWWVDLYHWGKGGANVPSPQSDEYINWIVDSVPDLDDRSIAWQDGRPANTIAKDFRIAAMLDWEIAGLGPGEMDLFFHFFMHQIREGQVGANKLEGIPSEDEQIAHYESVVGHEVREAEFFRRFVRARGAIIQIVYCRSVGMPLEEISFTGVLDDASFAGNY